MGNEFNAISEWAKQIELGELIPSRGRGAADMFLFPNFGSQRLEICDKVSLNGDHTYPLTVADIRQAEREQEIARRFKNYRSIDWFVDHED